MLGDIVISIIVWFLSTIIGFFPTSDGFPPEVVNAFAAIGGYTQIFTPIIPFGTLAAVMAIVFSTEIAIFGFKTLRWLLGHIPFIGGNH